MNAQKSANGAVHRVKISDARLPPSCIKLNMIVNAEDDS